MYVGLWFLFFRPPLVRCDLISPGHQLNLAPPRPGPPASPAPPQPPGMQRRPIRPPDLNGSFLTAIKRACREARGRPIRRLRRLPRLWACSRPPSRRPRPPRRWARPPGRAERGFGGFGALLRMGAGGAAGGAQWCDAGRAYFFRGRPPPWNPVPKQPR